jgi:glycosyltransferase involved in cell wall biosynthesis
VINPTSKTVLFLFTNEYPCSKVLEHYIGHEIKFLAGTFNKVIIVPSTPGEIQKEIPLNVSVINLYDKQWFKASFFSILSCLPLFFAVSITELVSKRKFYFSLSKFILDFKKFYNAYISGNAILKYAELNNINIKNAAFYSYWFYHAPLISGILKRRKKIDSFYSRAHLADLYTNQFPENDSFYNFKVKQIDKIALAAKHSVDYLENRFPKYKNKFIVSHVAVSDLGLNPQPGEDFVVVSCSSYSARKRVDLLAELIANSPMPLKWIHFGYIPPEIIENYYKKFSSSENIKSAKFLGDVSNEKLMEFYKKEAVSVIVNLSTSEGLPVSLIEATSFGIPSITTNVNGTPDITTEQNGFLIPVDFEPDLFYSCLAKIKQQGSVLRSGARNLFLKRFNSEINYPEIISLIKQ